MKVARVSVRPLGPGLLVEVWNAAGVRGVGEASPLVDYSDESLDDCATALATVDATRLVIDSRAPLPDQMAELLRPVQGAAAAACGLETALLDLLGRARSAPMHELLGAAPAPGVVALNALVCDEAEAVAAVRSGFSCLKLKLGRGAPARERELVRTLRHRFGDAVTLRFDVNRRWPASEAQERLRELQAFAPEYVEEPTDDLAALAGAPVPIGLDETLAEDHSLDLEALSITHNIRVVVLKPMRLGGAFRCLELARRARGAGIEPVITHMMDGPIALAAAAELSFAVAPRLACGLALHAGLACWPIDAPPQIRGPVARPGVRPGHGVEAP